MARTLRACCFAAMLAAGATAQRASSSTPTSTSASSITNVPSSSITASPKSTMGIPLSLWSVATSLLTEYFPSTTITDVRSLSWPSEIVIGTSTYTIHTSPTSTGAKTTGTGQTSPAASDFGSAASVKQSGGGLSDKTLSIVIGVVVGVVALLVMGIIFFCMHRRRKATGSFFLKRRTPSPRFWTPPHEDPENFGNTSYVTAGGVPYEQQAKLPEVAAMQQRDYTPPVSMHPVSLLAQSSRSTSDDNPFYTPQEHSTTQLNELDGQNFQHVELDHGEPAQRRSSSSAQNSRPPTPFSPLMMSQMPGPSHRPQLHVNPFASDEDGEAEDVVSPIVPTRNSERRHSPMVHYPSYDEVSEFNFSGDERESARQEDGYLPQRERRTGRYELA